MRSHLNQSQVSRRSVLEGIGVGALGLAGAALLGCSGGSKSTTGGVAQAPVKGATSGGGLPMTAPQVAGKIREGGVWTVAATSTYVQNDAHTVLGHSVWNVVSSRALEPDPNTAAIRPLVLTSWEVADPSGLTLVFKVSPKVFVQNMPPWNGRQFTAEDVAWNLERIGGLYASRLKIPLSSFQRASMVANITKAQAIDPLTVKVTLSKPNSAFFNGIMENRTCLMPKEMDDVGYSDPLKMGGIGAFQVSEWVKDQKMNYRRNPQYTQFRPGEPHFDAFNNIIVPDSAGTQAAFLSGQTQSVLVDAPGDVAAIKKAKPDANLYGWVDANYAHLRPSVEYAPFKDFRVRKAISLAIDYAVISDGYYGPGWGYQASLNPGYPEAWKPDKVKTLPGFNPDTKTQDRADAAKLLAAAGYPNGKGIDFGMTYTPGDLQNANVTRFQGQMTSVFSDMKVALRPAADSATFATTQADGRFQMVGYTITCTPDAVLDFTSQWHSQGSRNYGHFINQGLDTLMDRAIVELNKDARTKMLDEAQQRFMDEWMPMYVLCAQPKKFILQGDIGGFDKVVGPWFQYSTEAQAGRWYYVEK